MSWGWLGRFKRAIEFPNGIYVDVAPPGRGRLRYNDGAKQFEGSVDGAAYAPFGGGGVPSGWTDDGAVVRLTTPADQVVIGALTPDATEALRVVGSSYLDSRVGIGLDPTTFPGDAALGVQWNTETTVGIGQYNNLHKTGAGVLPYSAGVVAGAEVAAGTVNQYVHYLAAAPTGAGIVDMAVGLTIDDLSASPTVTTGLAINQLGANDANVFSGVVLLGTSTPPTGERLHVEGDALLQGETWSDGTILVGGSGFGDLDASAILQADSTTQGFAPPRMTRDQREAIAAPLTGLEVHNTSRSGSIDYFDGTRWREVAPYVDAGLLTGPTAYAAELDDLIRCAPALGIPTITLPTAVGAAMRAITVKEVTGSASPINIVTTGGQTIDGAASDSIALAYGAATYISDNANWMKFT